MNLVITVLISLATWLIQPVEMDTIDINSLTLNKISILSISDSSLVHELGTPDSIVVAFDTLVDDSELYIYNYGCNKISLKDNRAWTIEISDQNWNLTGFQVGDSEEKVAVGYPKSYMIKYHPTDEKHTIVPIAISINGKITDCYIYIYLMNGKIEQIKYLEGL